MEYEHGDILRVTKDGLQRVVHYVSGDELTVTVTPDPFSEKEITYRKRDVVIEVLGRESSSVSMEL